MEVYNEIPSLQLLPFYICGGYLFELNIVCRQSGKTAVHSLCSFQAGVNKIGVAIDRIELKQIGLPRDMQRNMASEAEARVQAGAKLVASEGESEANNRLVEAGDSLDVVSIHLRSVSYFAFSYWSRCIFLRSM